MHQLRKILIPFSLIYAGVMSIRNSLYNWGVLNSHSYDFPVICVGNLSVGGTGKSPMIEYLITHLGKDFRVACLSRGYKRKTKGFYNLTGSESAKEVGDEPLQFKTKFPEMIVAVDEKRIRGIYELMRIEPTPEVVLLDDALQHRRISAGLNILLTAYGDLYTEDYVLPAGNLREPRRGAERAQIIVVTKCPSSLSAEEKKFIKRHLKLEENQELFFCGITYGGNILNESIERALLTLKHEDFTLVTGIANPKPLVDYLISLGLKFDHLSFADHHNFTNQEIRELEQRQLILTTEKDFMRLKDSMGIQNLFYLPMEVVFLSPEEKLYFDALIKTFITKK